MNYLEVIERKILTVDTLDQFIIQHRFFGKKIVFTNGCFDIIHLGHITYLSKAAELGDILIVGVNSDASVKRLKGTDRPINNEHARVRILASLAFVDAICLFEEDTPYNLISKIKPDILVKGSDYTIENIIGADIILKNGGNVVTIDYLHGYSTTTIEQQIKAGKN